MLLEDIPLVYHGAEAKNSLVIDYKPQTSQLDIYWSDEDGGGSFNSRRNFKLPSGELLLAVDVYNEW
ncbi:MAG: hypothetical protein LBH96_04380 [Candidatus Peribacteria bacterium]|nr:hypothetical protein [Candidatus Peribacteria bacterium]